MALPKKSQRKNSNIGAAKLFSRGFFLADATGESRAACPRFSNSQKKYHLKHSSAAGFSLVFLCFFIATFIAAALAILPLGWWIQEKQKIELICEQGVLQAQDHLVQGMQKLIQRNPSVRGLVLEKKSLELAIRLAPTPMEKAALAVQLVAVIVKIKVLRTEQQWIIKSHEAASQAALLRLQQRIRTEIRHIENIWHSPPLTTRMSFPSPHIQLMPLFTDPMIPTYEVTPLVPSRQAIDIKIEINGKSIFPKEIEFLKMPRLNWRETCSAQPLLKGLQWKSHLREIPLLSHKLLSHKLGRLF